ncbi:nitroreductase/quinone reductase family protein [Micromonospora sp. L31]|uniref:nitroreductase/quinone reductase family protein n=1 Tax=Micromonospora sp. L31 TaxID=3452213 RepID=UPI003F8C6172
MAMAPSCQFSQGNAVRSADLTPGRFVAGGAAGDRRAVESRCSDRSVGRRVDRAWANMVAMVLPRRLARFNRVVTNRVTGPLAGRLPGFGVIIHRGRRSGRVYRTPINIFRTSDGYVAALTYGVTDWARNVLAAGSCDLEIRGRRAPLTRPRLVHDPTRRDMPPVVRQLVGMIGVTDFLYLDTVPDADHVRRA